jgi:beta-glucosidase
MDATPKSGESLPVPPAKGATRAEIAAAVEDIIAAMTLPEKVAMMSGQGFLASYRATDGKWCAEPYRAGGGCERLGLPPLYFTDGPRGVCAGASTCFPVSMARGASFDPDLERRIGEAMGVEIRAQGRTLSGAVCINLLRHPAWGRAQETYGEDPHLVGEMGAALAEGIQAHNVVATVKHFALNSIENARFKVDVIVDERTLREVYLPHFKRVLDAGCATVMSAYNKINGEYCGQNRYLLTDILRGEWGFDGFVHSDWIRGVYKVYGAAAGLDVENPEPLVFGDALTRAVEEGQVEPQVIDQACRRILSVQYRMACAEDPLAEYTPDLVACDTHLALAHEAACKGAVLLKNDGLLPLDRRAVKRLAVLGRLADLVNTGDGGSSRVSPPYVITPLAGLRAAMGNDHGGEVVTGDEADIAAAAVAAGSSDACVVVVGYTARDEGEFISGDVSLSETDAARRRAERGGDRVSLRLPDDQVALIRAAVAANPRTVVVMVAGSAVIVSEWDGVAPAILQSFYNGMEGGRALADLLFGVVSPSGKLPFTVPSDESHLPFFDKDADSIVYGPLHGYTLLEDQGQAAAYPFGFGLSYSSFGYRGLKVRLAAETIEVEVAVRNEGGVTADEVAQAYVGFPGTLATRPHKLLKAFKRVSLAPGEMRIVRLSIPFQSLKWWDPSIRDWRMEPGLHTVYVGGSSRDAEQLHRTVTLG